MATFASVIVRDLRGRILDIVPGVSLDEATVLRTVKDLRCLHGDEAVIDTRQILMARAAQHWSSAHGRSHHRLRL